MTNMLKNIEKADVHKLVALSNIEQSSNVFISIFPDFVVVEEDDKVLCGRTKINPIILVP